MKLEALKRLVSEWRNVEGTSHRWSSLKVRNLIEELLNALKASEKTYDRIAQRCDPASDTQMLHETRERAEAITIQLRETETIVRNLCRDFGQTHVNTCRRQQYDTRATVWDAIGCSRCQGEQTLEDLRTVFEAEERSHDVPRTSERHH